MGGTGVLRARAEVEALDQHRLLSLPFQGGWGTGRPSSLGPSEAWYAGVMRLTREVGARPEPAE